MQKLAGLSFITAATGEKQTEGQFPILGPGVSGVFQDLDSSLQSLSNIGRPISTGPLEVPDIESVTGLWRLVIVRYIIRIDLHSGRTVHVGNWRMSSCKMVMLISMQVTTHHQRHG